MIQPSERPDVGRRLVAVLAIVLVVLVVVTTFVTVVRDFPRLVAQLVLLAAAALAAWYGLTRVGRRRAIAVLIAIAAIAGIGLVGYAESGGGPVSLLIRVVLLLFAVALSRFALGRNVRALKQGETPGTPAQAATHGALIMNLKSGGGKAERFHLVEECRKRGIEPIVLQPGEDLLELARGAVDRGADVIGMAGGDGSQALVASIAAERGVPMVVVPAGTRNHLALDLGLDRNDVVGALDAFGEARVRPMDLGEVNGRIFVNNVSLGLYAAIVRSPAYRDAKVDTTLATLPQVLAPDTEPFDLRFTGPDGEPSSGRAHDPDLEQPVWLDARDAGKPSALGYRSPGHRLSRDPERRGGRELLGSGRDWAIRNGSKGCGPGRPRPSKCPQDRPSTSAWTARRSRWTSPLTFSIRSNAVAVRLPVRAIGYSPAARAMGWRSAVRNIFRVALGKPVST